MSEAIQDTTAAANSPAPVADKRAQAEKVLAEILALMDFPARLEFQDAADGGIAVAVHFQGEVPASPPGKRNYLIDSIQFLVNKIVNRPNTEKRWVSLGVGAFPEPRVAPVPVAAPVPAQAANKPAKGANPSPNKGNGHAPSPAKAAPASRAEPQEHTLDVTPDPALEALGKTLADKSARLGRYYAVTMMSAEDRARMMKAASGVKGVTVSAEGEDYLRRLLFVPDKPVAMPKKQVMPDYPDDEE